MTICITATGRDLDATVDPRFGRARYFAFVDPDKETIEVHENAPGAHGAGVQAAQLLVSKGATTLVTGSVGPNAFQGLSAAGIAIYTGASGTLREALAAYKAGTLTQTAGPTGRPHGGGGGGRR